MTVAPPGLAKSLADRYTIARELGAGGMATVYLARDIRHDRHVALKILRPELAAVIGAARFLNEIKTTANLQHPHILALHDSGEVDGTVFYVMPFVDGESLRDKLNREKQLPVDEALRIAGEVAGALEHAHQRGVIHRDIKPENILLQDGHALVADFGIALAAARSDGASRMTETGMSLGTPHYMSPEQAMGEREITARADIYALGCVLYEMLIGEPPFSGPTAQAIVARVMTEEPRSITTQRRTVPMHVEAAVNKALSKLPADRYASAARFADALVNPGAFEHTTALRPRPRARLRAPIMIAAAIVLTATAFVAGRGFAPPAPSALAQFVVIAPDSVTGIGRCCGTALAISPQGDVVVFAPSKSSEPLYRRAIGSLRAEPIPNTSTASVPFFSPDGAWLGFYLDGQLRKMAMAGGPILPIVAAPGGVFEASWGTRGVIVYATQNRLYTVAATGGKAEPLTMPDTNVRHFAPTFLPGGKTVLFSHHVVGTPVKSVVIAAVTLGSPKIDTIATGTRAQYASGYIVYADADNTLLAQPFDAKRARTTGDAVAMLERVALHGGITHEFALSTNGVLVYHEGSAGAGMGGDLLTLAAGSKRTAILAPGIVNENLEDATLSPVDGRHIVLRILTSSSVADLWMFDRQQGTLDRFTLNGGHSPSWSPDGKRIAYALSGGIYVKAADGTGEPKRLARGTNIRPGSWLPDNRTLLVQMGGENARADIGVVRDGDSTVTPLIATREFTERQPQASRDGHWIAYTSDRTGKSEVYVQPYPGGGASVKVSADGGESPRWSPDSRTLYYAATDTIIAATRAPGNAFEIANRKAVVAGGVTDLNEGNVNWDIHPNGKEFLFINMSGGASARVTWIQGWTGLVKSSGAARR